MRTEFAPSWPVSIFIAGRQNVAEAICNEFCAKVGLCVTIAPTRYVYAGGQEDGVVVGLINYPRFPKEPVQIEATAIELGMKLREGMGQESFSVQTPTTTTWFSWRAADAAQGIEARRATTAQQGVVHESPVPKECAQSPKDSTP